jgi:pyruvate kinase
VMVARGDLGVEMALPAVPVAQKRIAALCQRAGRLCIIATQMLESMTQSPTPTRAEVSDVANAVLDHADAVMLSGETAVGKFPVRAVRIMNDIVAEIQAYHDENLAAPRVVRAGAATTASLAAAVREILRAEPIAAVAAYTVTGTTALMMAKSRLTCPILALSPNVDTVRRMCMYYGVEAVRAPAPEHTRDVLGIASHFAVQKDIAHRGEKIVVLSGRPIGTPGCTNSLVVHTVE